MHKKLYKTASSMKTGMILLLILVIFSALGASLIPSIFYKIPIFKLVLVLLLINLIFCTINRTIKLRKFILYGQKKLSAWMKVIGVFILHLGLILILIGGTINTYSGQDGKVTLFAGDGVNISKYMQDLEHPFSIYLDKFEMEFNEDGSPSQYSSTVDIFVGEEPKEKVQISVNHPFTYDGVKFYQVSYGNVINMEYVDILDSKNNKEDYLMENSYFKVPDTELAISLIAYLPNYNKEKMSTDGLRPDNPRVIYAIYKNEELLGYDLAKFGDVFIIDDSHYIKFIGSEYYTVLDFKTDPGLPITALGGILLMLGVVLALFVKPQIEYNK